MSLIADIKKDLKGFSLNINLKSLGQPLGILGASGSGKSMTLKCIAGIEKPDKGCIEINGKTLFDSNHKINIKPQLRKVGYLFQDYALFPHRKVAENISCAMKGTKSEKNSKVNRLLKQFSLEGLESRLPRQLSGGQQQRVALARSFAYEPEVLLLDEPFSALDECLKESLQLEMMHLLAQYHGDIILVTHNQEEAYKLSQNLLVIESGKILEYGQTQKLFLTPEKLGTAKMTGVQNFSRCEKIGPYCVNALDWGCYLATGEKVSDHITHIGVRSQHFSPTMDGNIRNAIAVHLFQKVESPFEWHCILKAKNGMIENNMIWWKYPKSIHTSQMPAYLSVKPENIMLLLEDS